MSLVLKKADLNVNTRGRVRRGKKESTYEGHELTETFDHISENTNTLAILRNCILSAGILYNFVSRTLELKGVIVVFLFLPSKLC